MIGELKQQTPLELMLRASKLTAQLWQFGEPRVAHSATEPLITNECLTDCCPPSEALFKCWNVMRCRCSNSKHHHFNLLHHPANIIYRSSDSHYDARGPRFAKVDPIILSALSNCPLMRTNFCMLMCFSSFQR